MGYRGPIGEATGKNNIVDDIYDSNVVKGRREGVKVGTHPVPRKDKGGKTLAPQVAPHYTDGRHRCTASPRATVRTGESITFALLPFALRKRHLSRS